MWDKLKKIQRITRNSKTGIWKKNSNVKLYDSTKYPEDFINDIYMLRGN